MYIALVIPTTGRPDDLMACLQSIGREADDKVVQIVVIDDCSTPPVSVPQNIGKVPVLCFRNDVRRGAAASRNLALKAIDPRVEAIGFIDDDAKLCPDWIKIGRNALTRDRGAITGPVRRFDKGLVSIARQLRYDRRYAKLEPGQAVNFLAGGNSLIWRDLLERADGFPDTVTMSDRLLVRRLEAQGAGCHFIPELYILHRNSKGLKVAMREAWRAGQLDDTPQSEGMLPRLARGVAEAFSGPHILAGLLNVFLDGIYLISRARRKHLLIDNQAQPGRPK